MRVYPFEHHMHMYTCTCTHAHAHVHVHMCTCTCARAHARVSLLECVPLEHLALLLDGQFEDTGDLGVLQAELRHLRNPGSARAALSCWLLLGDRLAGESGRCGQWRCPVLLRIGLGGLTIAVSFASSSGSCIESSGEGTASFGGGSFSL